MTEADGHFVWHDLMTGDVAAAKRFYGALWSSWDIVPTDMGAFGTYQMIRSWGESIGGLISLGDAPMESHWVSYIGCRDIKATCAAITGAGGEVCVPPTAIPGVGTFAVATDPTGAVFSPFTADPEMRSEFAQSVDGAPDDGDLVWHELVTTDPDAAARFYGDVFGMNVRVVDIDEDPYTVLEAGETPVAGVLRLPDGIEARPQWLPYFRTGVLETQLSRAVTLGAETVYGPQPIEGYGMMVVLKDPTGAAFAIYQGNLVD